MHPALVDSLPVAALLAAASVAAFAFVWLRLSRPKTPRSLSAFSPDPADDWSSPCDPCGGSGEAWGRECRTCRGTGRRW